MKTLIIYNHIENSIKFLVVDGDFSPFHGIVINSLHETGFEQEFCDWMYDKDTGRLLSDEWSEDKSIIENKQWDKVAICTWIP